MAAVDVKADVPMSPQDMWEHVSDLSELGEWLVMHEAWRGELPAEIAIRSTLAVARRSGLIEVSVRMCAESSCACALVLRTH